jgi:hypothetical protein
MSAALREDLAGMIHFDFDQAQIQPDDRAALDRKATILAANPAVRLRIAGGCDERGSVAYNVALGSRRAAAAKQYLIERGIDAGRLEEFSSGEGSPIDPGQNEAAWVQNRRAEFEVRNAGGRCSTGAARRATWAQPAPITTTGSCTRRRKPGWTERTRRVRRTRPTARPRCVRYGSTRRIFTTAARPPSRTSCGITIGLVPSVSQRHSNETSWNT